MKSAAHLSLALLTTLAAAGVHAAPPTMKPGQWEIETRMQMNGGGMQMPGQTVTIKHCIKPEDVRPNDPTMYQGKQDKNCKLDSMSQTGNGVKWKVTCQGQFSGTGEGEVTMASENAYQGKMTMNADMGGHGTMSMITSFNGKRLGDCPAKQ